MPRRCIAKAGWTLSSFYAGNCRQTVRARILHRDDWVFSSKVLKVFGKLVDADLISLKDDKDRLIGDWKRLRRGEQNLGTASQQTRFAF